MDDGRLLTESIKIHPRERTLRLIYADWLEEHEQPERANMIRLSMAEKQASSESERIQITERIDTLIKEHKTRWCRPNLSPREVEYCDGMPFAHLEIGYFLSQIEELLHSHPDLVGVNIIDYQRRGLIGRAVRSQLLINFNRLTLCTMLTDNEVIALARNPATVRLTHLALPLTEMSSRAVGAIAQSPHLSGLVSLAVKTQNMTPDDVSIVSSGVYSDSLERLDLSFCHLDDDGIRALAQDGPILPNLNKLELWGNWVTGDGLARLAASQRWVDTTALDLSGMQCIRFTGTIKELRAALASRGGFGRGPAWTR